DAAPGPAIPVGASVTWKYVVTNTGTSAISNVVVSDDNGTPSVGDDFNPVFIGGDSNGNTQLDTTETWTYQAIGTAVAGPYQNVGTVTGKDFSGSTLTDSDFSHYHQEQPEVDAQIDVGPLTATNKVGDPHTVTATVQVDDGTGWAPAGSGVTVNFNLLNNTAGASFVGSSSPTTNASGQASVQINSSTPGSVDIHAWTTVMVGGIPLTRQTDGTGDNSDDAGKTYVDAQIDVGPLTATNKVGDPHTVTATVQVDDGTGWAPAASGVTVNFSLLNNTAGASFIGGSSATTNASGQASVQINSSTPGSVYIRASATVAVGGIPLTRQTDGTGNNSDDAGKTYVHARMTFGPDEATNVVGDPHTFTAHLQINDGTGWSNADGETISIVKTSGPGLLSPPGPSYVTDSNGEVDVTLNSDIPGVTIVTASWNGTVLGSSVSASDPADKTWVSPGLSIAKTGPTSAAVGETIAYTITVINTGAVTLHNVVVTDAKLGLNVNLGTLAPGGSTTLIPAPTYVISEADLPGPVENTAIADSDETDPVSDDHVVNLRTSLADLVVDKTVDEPINVEGGIVTFTVTVTNDGPGDTTGVVLRDALPLGLVYISDNGGGDYSDVSNRWEVGTLLLGASASLQISALADAGTAGTTITNTALVIETDVEDPDESNNEDSADVTIVAADLAVIKTVDEPTPTEGDTIVWTVTVTNNGPVDATGVVLSDILPDGLAYVDDDGAGSFNETSGNWFIGLLPVAASRTLNIIAEIDAGTAGTTITNTASVEEADQPDPDPSNNEDSADVTVSADGGEGGAAEECDGKVIISEIAWAGTAADPDDEWIEIRNIGGEPIDLAGWILRWRKKQPVTTEDFQWKVVPLSGELQASSTPVCELIDREPEPTVEFVKREIDDLSWFVVARPVDHDESYMLLERKSDLTISNVDANIIYDDVAPYSLELSNEGDIIELLDADGEIVDTANAFPSYYGNWPAGNALTRGTMERIDPLGPDERDNWHTNLGIITRGVDANGRPLIASADVVNSQTLEEMELFVDLNAVNTLPGARLDVGLDLLREVRRETGWPWIRVTRPGYEVAADAAGGGGQLAVPVYLFAGRYSNDTYWLGIDTAGLVPGDYLVWVVYGEGQTVLVPITVLD
ncbi:lamin tail domain-containing protein, partial [Candidatus Bipolaricaulota bacterium]